MKLFLLIVILALSGILFAGKCPDNQVFQNGKCSPCVEHAKPDSESSCACEKDYVMNPKGNVCCKPNHVWQNEKCVPCTKNAHPKIQKINGIDAAVSCDCDEGFVMNKEGNKCSKAK